MGTVFVRGGKDLDGATFVDAASESTLRELVNAVKGENKPTSSSSGQPTDPNTKKTNLFGDSAEKAANSIMDLSRMFAQGGVQTSEFINQVGKSVGVNATVTRAISGMAGYAEQSNRVLKDLSTTGMTFGGSIEELRQQAAGTRLSFEEFQTVMRVNQDQIAMMGATGKDAARNFTSFSKQFMDSPFSGELLGMGYNFEEINGMLATYGAMTASSNRDRLGADSSQIQSAMALAKEMDTISRLTGKNREELQKEMAARARDGQVNAFLMGKSEDVQKAFQAQMSTMSATLGPKFEKFSKDMVIRGFAGMDVKELYSFPGLAEKMAEAKQALDAGNVDEFNRLMGEAGAAASKYMKSEEYRSQAVMGDASNYSQTMADLGTSSAVFQARMTEAARKYPELANNEIKLREKVLEDIKAQQAQEAAGGDKTTAALNKLDQASRDASLALTKELIVPLSNVVGPSLLKIGEGLQAFTNEQIASAKTEFDAVDKIVNDAKKKAEAPMAPTTKPTTAPTTAPAESAPTTPKPYDYIPGSKPISREFGSLGMTGKLFEDFGEGTLAMLHGKESVMTPGQLSGLISKATARPMAVPEGMESMVSGMTSKMQTMASQMAQNTNQMISQLPQTDMTRMFDPQVMTDIAGSLEQLNKSMAQVAENTSEQVDVSMKQIKATRGLSGDLFKGL